MIILKKTMLMKMMIMIPMSIIVIERGKTCPGTRMTTVDTRTIEQGPINQKCHLKAEMMTGKLKDLKKY